MRRRRYSGYSGQSGVGNTLKVIAWMLVIMLMLTLAGLLIGQRYLVYTDDGVQLELPFFHRESNPPDTSVPVNIVQLPGMPKPEPEASQAQPEQPDLPQKEIPLT